MDYPFVSTTTTRVNYFDTDKMGVVWHGNYIKYFEMGREEAFRSIGLSYSQLEAEGVMMPIVDLSAEYFKPAVYDEVLTIETRVEKAPGARMRFDYVIRNEKGEVNVTGQTTLAFIQSSTRRPCRPPVALRSQVARSSRPSGVL